MHDFNPGQLRERMDSMHAIEKSADEVRHDMMDELVTAFITPFDREDIDELGHVLDDVTDSIEGVLNRMYYDNVTDMRDDAVQMSDMVVRATESICELVNELPRFRHSKTLRELVFAINTIETDADHLFIESMRTLHTTCTDPLQVFAWHDVYRHLETVLRRLRARGQHHRQYRHEKQLRLVFHNLPLMSRAVKKTPEAVFRRG